MASLPTDFGFTGQRNEATIELYDYRARYYAPTLGRFISADTIVPEPGNPQDLNRYAYTRNNPLRYTDPSGYCIPGVNCPDDPPRPAWSPPSGYQPQSTEEQIALLGWVQAQIELERRETGGTVVASLMQQSLNLELSTLMKYVSPEKAERLAWQGAMMGAPFAAAAVGSLAGDAAEDAVLAWLDLVPSGYRASVAQAFEGTPMVETLTEDLIVYRRWGGEARETGSPWFSPKPYVRPGNARRYLALPNTNTAENVSVFKIPAGTTIIRGEVAPRVRDYGPHAVGGGMQIYLPDPEKAILLGPLDVVGK
ncbi:MAG: RHS repeat-associated core domain-containing protein [Anaerolineae bacterium]|nr:RHS repeat-associated core domain-containing protein [Anaerolineae bacterium]